MKHTSEKVLWLSNYRALLNVWSTLMQKTGDIWKSTRALLNTKPIALLTQGTLHTTYVYTKQEALGNAHGMTTYVHVHNWVCTYMYIHTYVHTLYWGCLCPCVCERDRSATYEDECGSKKKLTYLCVYIWKEIKGSKG